MTGLLANGIRLPLVLCHAGVHALNNVRTDRAQEDGGHRVRAARPLPVLANNRDCGPRSHLDRLCSRRGNDSIILWFED